MASSKLLLNLSATFLCSYRVSSSPSSRRLLSFYTLSPLPKSQLSLRFCTSAAATTAVDLATAALSGHEEAPLVVGHPWPEWDSFVDKLRSKGYFERAPTTTEEEGEGEGKDATMDTNKLKNACLKFGRDRFDILSSLPKQELRAVVECGCPNLFRKAVNSSKRLRVFLQIDEAHACGVCKLRGSCDKAYVAPKNDQARTVDIIRVLLTYALEPNNLSGGEHFVQTNVQESARNLLTELIRLSDTTIDPSLPKPNLHKVSSKKEEVRESRSKASSKSRQSVGVEMKKGDWLCPKCNFLNFSRNMRCFECNETGPKVAGPSEIQMKPGDWTCPKCNFLNFSRNMRCFECNETGPKVAGPSEIQMKPGDWTCPKCEFMNFARNRACFRCEEPHKRMLNFGEWECQSCNYVNFKRNQECRRCNCERPQGTVNQLQDRLWEKPKQSFRGNNFKFGDDSYGTEQEEEHGGISTFDGYRNTGWRNRERNAE